MNARHPISLALLAGLLVGPALADVALPTIFSDHLVLRRAQKVPVWGTAAPGEVVTVALPNQSAAAVFYRHPQRLPQRRFPRQDAQGKARLALKP